MLCWKLQTEHEVQYRKLLSEDQIKLSNIMQLTIALQCIDGVKGHWGRAPHIMYKTPQSRHKC